MKVTIINSDFRVYWKGRLIYLHQFLAEKNIDFTAIELFGEGSPYSFDTYTGHYSWWRCLFPNQHPDKLSKKNIAKKIFDELDSINPDVVIASSIVFFSGALGMRWAKKNKKKFVMFDDIKPAQVKRNFLVQLIKNAIIKQSDALWVPDSGYDNEYADLLHKKIYCFYGLSCIDNDFFKPKDKKQLNYHNILCVARLVPVKNIDSLLRVWQLIEQANTGYKLTIIGDGAQFNHLTKLAAQLNLTNVIFLGNINNTDIPHHYHHSDAFILPSLSETWGLVVNEAMAAGLPVVLSNKINAVNSLLSENVNGYSFEPLNIAEMAAALVKYINLDIAKKQKMSQASLKIIKTMSYRNMGDKLVAALNKIDSQPFKSPGILTIKIINNWYGRYNTAGWDYADPV